jgi:hypothetical protein
MDEWSEYDVADIYEYSLAYKGQVWFGVLCGILLTLALIYTAFFAFPQSPDQRIPFLALLISAPLLTGFLLWYAYTLQTRIAVTESYIARVRPGAAPLLIGWSEIAAIKHSAWSGLKLESMTRQRVLTIEQNISGFEELGQVIYERAAAAGAPAMRDTVG